jgi:hypothetical protein
VPRGECCIGGMFGRITASRAVKRQHVEDQTHSQPLGCRAERGLLHRSQWCTAVPSPPGGLGVRPHRLRGPG